MFWFTEPSSGQITEHSTGTFIVCTLTECTSTVCWYLAWWWVSEPKHVAEFLILIANICCIIDWINYCVIQILQAFMNKIIIFRLCVNEREREMCNVQEIVMFVLWQQQFIGMHSCMHVYIFCHCRHFEHCRSKVEPLQITWLQWRLTAAV